MNGLNLDLKGQKVLVTGASAGLGTYLCESFSAAGADIGIHYNDSSENAIVLERELRKKGKAYTFKANLKEPESTRLLFKEALDELDKL